MIKNNINRRILSLMKEQKVTQRDLADLLGVAQPTVHQRLNSDKTFEIEDLIKVCRLLKVSVTDVIYESTLDEGEHPPTQVLSASDLLMISTKRHEDIMKKIAEQVSLTTQLIGHVNNLEGLIKKSLERQN